MENNNNNSSLVKLNVGGRRFMTSRTTLETFPNTFFTSLMSGNFGNTYDEKGYIFIDRSPTYFEPILEYMRTHTWRCPPFLENEVLEEEASFYGIVLPTKNEEKFSDMSLTKMWSDENSKKNQIQTDIDKKYLEDNPFAKLLLETIIFKIQDMINKQPISFDFHVYIFASLKEMHKTHLSVNCRTKNAAVEFIVNKEMSEFVLGKNNESGQNHYLWNNLVRVVKNVYDLSIIFSSASVSEGKNMYIFGSVVTWTPKKAK